MIREACAHLASASEAEIDLFASAIAALPATRISVGGSTYALWRGAYYLSEATIPAEPRPYTKFQGGVFPVADRIVTYFAWPADREASDPESIGGFKYVSSLDQTGFVASHTAFGAPVTGTAKMTSSPCGKFGGVELRRLLRIEFTSDDGFERVATWGQYGVESITQSRADGYTRVHFDRNGGIESSITVAGAVTTERRLARTGPEQGFMPRTVTTRVHEMLTRIVHKEFRTEASVTAWRLHLGGAPVTVSKCNFERGVYDMRCGAFVYLFREIEPTKFQYLGKIPD